MYQIETFKKIKTEKKIKGNKKHGTSGNTGKNYANRSFGGAMSNRKYTKKQVKKHKLLPNEMRTGEISNIKPDNKQLVPPLYPTTLGSIGSNNRSGYINPSDTTIIPNPNNINKYIYPSQELENVQMESEIGSNNITSTNDPNKNYKIYIENTNINNDKNINDNINPIDNNNKHGDRWSDNTYNGGYYGPYSWFSYNPYLFGQDPYMYRQDQYDNKKNIIINNYKNNILENMDDIEVPETINNNENNNEKNNEKNNENNNENNNEKNNEKHNENNNLYRYNKNNETYSQYIKYIVLILIIIIIIKIFL